MKEKLSQATTAKAVADAQAEQAKSQLALGSAQAQLPFAVLQGIKAGINGLTLPGGKEGTVTIAKGTDGTALLRSKKPLLDVLDEIAAELMKDCTGAVLLTEAQLTESFQAQYVLARIGDETQQLTDAVSQTRPHEDKAGLEMTGASFVAGAYTVGFVLDTLNSLGKLLRIDRKLDVFDANTEALSLLGYLLESKCKDFNANPALLGSKVVTEEADKLRIALQSLGNQVQIAQAAHDKLPKPAEGQPVPESHSQLKAEIERATTLRDGLDPTKKPDDFWKQVAGQVLAANTMGRKRLVLDIKAQSVQITESRWYGSDRLLAMGEVQLAYRVFHADGSLEKSGVLLRTSEAQTIVHTRCFGLCQESTFEKIQWPRSTV